MKIVLQRDLTGPKAIEHGFIEGAVFDWPRSVITSISQQEGNNDWFRFSTEVERSMRNSSVKNLKASEAKKTEEVEVSDDKKTVASKADEAIMGSRKKAKE